MMRCPAAKQQVEVPGRISEVTRQQVGGSYTARADDVIVNANSVTVSQVVNEPCGEAWDVWLVPSENQRSEQTVVNQSCSKLRKKMTFAEDDEVIVYDLKSKLSYTGKIIEVLGNNTYLADYGNGPQHVSGDVISKVSDMSKRQIGVSQDVIEPNGQSIENGNDDEDMLVDQNDDIMSISTDTTSEHDVTDIVNRIPIVHVPRQVRRYRRNAEMLGPVVNQRLRNRR